MEGNWTSLRDEIRRPKRLKVDGPKESKISRVGISTLLDVNFYISGPSTLVFYFVDLILIDCSL